MIRDEPTASLPLDALVEDRTTLGDLTPGAPTQADPVPAPPPLAPHLKLVHPRRPSTARGSSGGWSPRPIDEALFDLLPPEAGAPNHDSRDVAPHVRREESVVAEAVAEKASTLWKVRAAAEGVSGQVRVAVDALGGSTLSALRRFEALPRRRQIMWVAAPYAGAALLIALLLIFGGTGAEEAPPVRVPAEAPVPVPVPVPVTKATATPAPRQPVEAPPSKAPAPPVKPRAVRHRLTVWSRLFVRPDAGYKIAAHLRPGTEITLYPGFEAPEGWRLARSAKGTIGFIMTERLDGVPVKKKHRRRRRR